MSCELPRTRSILLAIAPQLAWHTSAVQQPFAQRMRRQKDELASAHLLPHLHTPSPPPTAFSMYQVHINAAPSRGPLHVLLPLPAVLCPSSPSLSLCPLPGHSYPFLRLQHKHPSPVSLCTSPSMRLDVYTSDHFHSTCLYLKPPSLCEHVLTISLLTIPPGSLTISCTDSPHAPSRSVRPTEHPPSSG